MLKQRRQAAERVAEDFRKVEAAADEAAMLAATCVSTMIEQRAAANLPVATGLDAIKLMMDATADLVAARRKLMELHGELVLVRDGIGIKSFGDEAECPPKASTQTSEVVHLKVVA